MSDDGGPAFPQNDAGVNRMNNHDGMSLRDYFAAKAMQRIHVIDKHGAMSPEITARAAYLQADEMLKARDAT